MHEELTEEGETASPNRIARIMAKAGLQGIAKTRQWRRKRSGVRPAYLRNHYGGRVISRSMSTARIATWCVEWRTTGAAAAVQPEGLRP